MPDYQWKLTILERNLLLSNWTKLMPEAQERILEEADELMGEIPVSDKERLLNYLETLQNHAEPNFWCKLNQILSNQSSSGIKRVLELSIQTINLSSDDLQLAYGH